MSVLVSAHGAGATFFRSAIAWCRTESHIAMSHLPALVVTACPGGYSCLTSMSFEAGLCSDRDTEQELLA